MNKQLIAKLALVAVAAGAFGAAQAATATAQFNVTMTISSSCSVATPSNVNLGTVTAQTAAVSQTGSTTINVTCSKGTPFFIGLAPSNANTAGAGVMSGTGSNTDKVPYTLHQTSASGPVWGNTATNLAVGNGVAGTGAGMATAVPFTAYAKAVNADSTPDTYTDTVTVNVNY